MATWFAYEMYKNNSAVDTNCFTYLHVNVGETLKLQTTKIILVFNKYYLRKIQAIHVAAATKQVK